MFININSASVPTTTGFFLGKTKEREKTRKDKYAEVLGKLAKEEVIGQTPDPMILKHL